MLRKLIWRVRTKLRKGNEQTRMNYKLNNASSSLMFMILLSMSMSFIITFLTCSGLGFLFFTQSNVSVLVNAWTAPPPRPASSILSSRKRILPHRQRRHSRYFVRLNAIGGNYSETTASSSSSSLSSSKKELPDFGKTTVEVDTIKLEKKKRKREEEEDVTAKWIRKDLFGSSLVNQTMDELKNDQEFQSTQKRIATVGLEGVSKEERKQRRRALNNLNVQPFAKFISTEMKKKQQQQERCKDDSVVSTTETAVAAPTTTKKEAAGASSKFFKLKRKEPKILQINIGLYCNQACAHCHVESSPMKTKEMMTTNTVVQCLELLKNTPSITTLDVTGGAPELNENFRYLVSTARAIRGDDLIIIDRCNLTVLQEPGQEDLVQFLKRHNVHIIASLPCYSADNVDTQRGNGVFERSIAALLALNRVGYGHHNHDNNNSNNNDNDKDVLQLDLVYNPLGAFLPPPQDKLEEQYKKQLKDNFGILFNSLYTITNMPIKRFADFLHRRGELEEYMDLLVRNFNLDTVPQLMCLDTINIGWDGKIYDCDFNQQLGYSIGVDSIHRGGKTVFDIESLDDLRNTNIRTDNHCFGCTSGMGSS